MATVTARATRAVDASPEQVLAFLRDYRESRPRILTDNYSQYRVESGGQGQGTVIGYHFAAGGRERDYRLSVEEDGAGLSERDQLSSFVSRWTVAPGEAGAQVTRRSLVAGRRWDRRGVRADVRADGAAADLRRDAREALRGRLSLTRSAS